MGFDSARTLTDAMTNGYTKISTFRKQPTQTTGAGVWFDLSMSPGNPNPNYYIGPANTFTHLKQSTDGGIPHGGNVSPKTKHLHRLTLLSATSTANPLPVYMLDYIGFYPFIDESITDEQFLDNTNTLSRYTDGAGVQAMAVVVAGHSGAAGVDFYINYTNSNGEVGRVSQTHRLTSQIVNGTIITSAGATTNSRGPFMALQNGDTGIRSIQSITFQGTGDVGLISIALVKPICMMSMRETTAATECEFFTMKNTMPVIADDAYLNLLAYPAGTLAAAPIHGIIETVWN